MSIAEKNRIFLEKLRNLSDAKKRIILWTVVIILGLTMGYFWINSTVKSFSKMGEPVKIPSIGAPQMPALNICKQQRLATEHFRQE